MRLSLFSFLILFFELALIRYLPGHVKATAYFANLTVIATFLGMGLGLLLARRRPMSRFAATFPAAFVVLLLVVTYFANFHVEPLVTSSEFFWPAGQMHGKVVQTIGIRQAIAVLFVLTTICFVPLGHGLGIEFRRYPPLVGYTLDIVGSLLGTASFGLMSLLGLPPSTWFLVGGLGATALFVKHRPLLVASLLLTAVSWYLPWHLDQASSARWSPYYKITRHPFPSTTPGTSRQSFPVVYVNDAFHQMMVNMDLDQAESEPLLDKFKRDYHSPWARLGARRRVLVIGAGTGNDVEVALLHGAEHVDAVEIDPVILEVGKMEHPNRPYADPRVSTYNTDGRVFLKNASGPYDLIVYGTLDSHTMLAGQSNVRLDNYLYTKEAFDQVRRLLADDGVFALQILVLEKYIGEKVFLSLTSAFGDPPLVIDYKKYTHFNHVFLVGPSFHGPDPFEARALVEDRARELPHDDWPFLYLRTRSIPSYYWQFGLIVLSTAVVGLGAVGGRSILKGPRPAMLLLGSGFLLLETASITAFALLYGSTWVTNVFVFVSILFVILIANLSVMRFPSMPPAIIFAGLFASLAARYAIPVGGLLEGTALTREIATVVFTGLPILFASILFARLFEGESEPAAALGWNVFGAVLGGLLESASMVVGIRAMYAIAGMIYLGLALLILKSKGASPVGAPLPSAGTSG